jgi:hypothetical protein
MVSLTRYLYTNKMLNSANIECNGGINVYTPTSSPSLTSYNEDTNNGTIRKTYCFYPMVANNNSFDCNTKYLYPTAQRFCSCTIC